MKTKITLLIILLVSINISAQINKNISKKTLKPNTTLKLPLLKANSSDKYTERDLDKIKEVVTTKSNLIITPKPYSKSSSALNVTLTPNKMKTSDAALAFRGTYSNSRIKIFGKTRDLMEVNFKAKRNKTYRVKLNFYLFFQDKWCQKAGFPFKKRVYTGGNMQEFNVKSGANSLDFLIKSDVDGRISFMPLTWFGFTCNGNGFYDKTLEQRFMNITIQELQN